ncbi:hypothetical protein [Pseudobacteroides cellulosolvens]|uniref:Uncharacterized protein n=1 Tax=Pseudobacteroides cellulosolvens ATCC 35603 = DSM 2933 TaxID=398512 RepID=A0A0L6JG06_9FIRM|nr:hypothetical protein [Pseudobacteroides cellulosolvens]KNY24781.1 hypothetical protein Bccel_0038 [Pseudobacteroides cellulosolvens ATCC 35603 = DSM 2933]
MRGHITIDPETLSIIEKMINQNFNLNKITNVLKKDRNISLSNTTVGGIVKRNFQKVWDKELKLWVELRIDPKGFTSNSQIGIDDIFQFTSSPEKKDNNMLLIKSEPSSGHSKETQVNSNPKLEDLINTILQKTYRLEKGVEDIKKALSRIEVDNPKEKLINLNNDFVKIFASEKSKASVSINSELKEKTKKFIEEAYGIKDNDSLAINIALLLALYNRNR